MGFARLASRVLTAASERDAGVRILDHLRSASIARRGRLLALLLLAHGAIAIERLDALAALELAVLLWAAYRRHFATFGLVAGLLFATKVVPVLVALPLLAASGERGRRGMDDSRSRCLVRRGGRAKRHSPMVVLSPSSLSAVIAYHAQRGLPVESALGVLYGATRFVTGHAERATHDCGSYKLSRCARGPLASAYDRSRPSRQLRRVASILGRRPRCGGTTA